MMTQLNIEVKGISPQKRNLSDLVDVLRGLNGVESVEFIKPENVDGFYRIKGTNLHWTSIHKKIISSGYSVPYIRCYSKENNPYAIKLAQKQK